MREEKVKLNYYQSQSFNSDKCSTGFFTRQGGVSTGLYSSLNCSKKSDDDSKNINKNLLLIQNEFQTPNEVKQLRQTHTNQVYILTDKHFDCSDIEADSIITKLKNVPIGVVTADCTPILLIDEKNGIISAIHAGWHGAIAGVIQNTISKMLSCGAETKNIKACIGPTIIQKNYEVDSDFHKKFLSQDQENEKLFYLSINKNRYMFDLSGYNEKTLKSQGISEIENLKLDTYSNENLFFSNRRRTHRNELVYGCQLSAIMLK